MLEKYDGSSEVINTFIELIGREATEKIVIAFGGAYLYIPKCDDSIMKNRNDEIYSKFRSGTGFSELAKQYKLSTKTIRTIIREKEDEYQHLRDPERNEQIRLDHHNGMKYSDIGKKYGLTITFIRAVIDNDKL